MGITQVEELEDKIRVHYTLFQYYAEHDHPETMEILYADVPNLPKEPESLRQYYAKAMYDHPDVQTICIKKLGTSIRFIINQYEEQNGSETETQLHGPFLC